MRGERDAAAPVANWRLLPLFLTVLFAAFAFKTGHLASDVIRIAATAQAQEAHQPAAAAEEPVTKAADEAAPEAADGAAAAEGSGVPAAGISRAEMTLLEDLRARRRELENRERKVELRERLLATTEQRIDRRIGEMRAIEKHIAELVAEHEKRQDEQIQSVVSMYEKMKPKDAAQIFQRLDMDIQTAVATRMKESKMAALLAQMDPEAAKMLTTQLAQREELPQAAQILDQTKTP